MENAILLSQVETGFEKKCRAEGLSEKTIRWYEYGINRCNDFLERQIGKTILEATDDDIRDFVIWLQDNYSGATVTGNLTTLRIFLGYAASRGAVKKNFAQLVKKPKTKQKVIYALTRDEVVEFLEFYKRDTTFHGIRNHAILVTLLSTGIRKAELLDMRVSEIAIATDFFRVIGKGNKERVVPIGDTLRKTLESYIRAREKFQRETGIRSPYLWLNRNGERLTESGIDNMFKTIKNSAHKWSTRISAHTLRHTFATLYLANGGDVFSLQKLLGHSDISVTRIYAEMNSNQLTKVATRYNPLDNTAWLR